MATISEITLTVDTSRIRPLVNLFSEIFEEHRQMAERLECLDEDKLEEWVERFYDALQIAHRRES